MFFQSFIIVSAMFFGHLACALCQTSALLFNYCYLWLYCIYYFIFISENEKNLLENLLKADLSTYLLLTYIPTYFILETG